MNMREADDVDELPAYNTSEYRRGALHCIDMRSRKTRRQTLRMSHQWVNEKDVVFCSKLSCGVEFDFLVRKYQCRNCGSYFCNACCEKKVREQCPRRRALANNCVRREPPVQPTRACLNETATRHAHRYPLLPIECCDQRSVHAPLRVPDNICFTLTFTNVFICQCDAQGAGRLRFEECATDT